ncbi:MAG: beta-ketoacyl-ACP synthase III [Legionellaceae bacterium]|nr:beta-ketoacyl-ACP synthase III [Legionellaceae bacterium]
MRHAVISGTGSYLPKGSMSNQVLETRLDTTHEWIFARTGIASRHIAEAHETTGYMASQAGAQAIKAAGLSPDQIDLILVATCTPDRFFPSMACQVQHDLGITRTIPALDISAACSGFIYGMDIAKQYLVAGAAQHVLVIGSETMSRALDWTDRSTCILFGDGAGAAVLSASETPGILASCLHASYDAADLLTFPNYTTSDSVGLIGMRGSDVFKIAVNIMGDIVEEVLSAGGLNKSDVHWLIPHQANIRIIQAIAKKLDMPMSQVIVTIENQGNTSAASIPLALDHAVRQGQVQRGQVLLLESFGGGMTWGAMLVRY